jgi:hypothetical protein
MAKLQTKVGDCETCIESKQVELTPLNDMWMCITCFTAESEVMERNKQVSVKIIEESRKIDSKIELKQDIFNAATVSFTELAAAIAQNADIPAEKKNYTLATECASRLEILNKAIFEEEAALTAKKNERHAWLINTQNVAARLHEKEREKFKQYEINYKPQPVKKIKPQTVKAPKDKAAKTFDKKALYEACKKYNVPAAQVQSLIISRNMSAEDAAKHFAELMGLL